MRYSIYGATGFIGGNFCKLFDDLVVCQKREERKPKTNNIIYFISTIDNYNIHTNITLDVETNLKVFCEVLDHCRDNNITFNFISSWFVYGQTDLPAKEDYYCHPMGFYSVTKKAAEDLLISFCKTYGVKYRILRLCNVLGQGDCKVSSKKNALSYMIDLLKKNEDVHLYDGGTSIRDFMHVDDVCRAIKLVCEKGNFDEIYNIGSGDPIRISSIIESAREYLGSTSKIINKESPDFYKVIQIPNFWMNVDKLNLLGFNRKISNDQIIIELCQ